jgi:hypothetical protein
VRRILPPPAPAGQGIGARLLHASPDLGLGAVFVLAWMNLLGLGSRYGVSLMLLVEIEGWILIVTFLTTGLVYGLATDTELREKLKNLGLLVLACAIPPIVFAMRWHVWWPVGAYAGLLWNRVRLARAGAAGARRMRTPIRELVLYGSAAAASMLMAIPPLGAAEANFRIADFPGWCHAPELVIPDELLRGQQVVTWCTEPHRALAAGGIYFAMTGLLTLLRGPYRLSLLFGWVRREPEE